MDRFPPLNDECFKDLILDQSSVLSNLEAAYTKAITQNPNLLEATNNFLEKKNLGSLQLLCDCIFATLPMPPDEKLYPLLPTGEQLAEYINGNPKEFWDCKLLTIITAYICIVLGGLPTVISIRSYYGHPVLYVELSDETYKISYLNQRPQVRLFDGRPLEQIEGRSYLTNFDDDGFPNDTSILYWRVSDAIYLLDCINIFRRVVINYAYDPEKYNQIFNETIQLLNASNIYHNSIAQYWQSELRRVKEMWEDPRGTKDPDRFKRIVIGSLRF